MASIKKRPNGTYQATIYVGRDADGKQLFRYVTRDKEKDCKSAAREIEQEIENKNFTNIGNIKLVDWINEWIELNRDRISPSTHSTYKLYSKVHYAPYFKNLKLSQVTEIHVRRFMAEQLKKLSPTTVRKHISVLKRILEDALKQKNPARGVKLPAKRKYVPYVYSDEEFERLHNIVRGTRDELIILLAAWCGLRRGEIFALKPNDIDWGNGIIRVDEAVSINEDYMYVDKSPKSSKGFREVVVPDYLMGLLEGQRRAQKEIPERLFPIRADHYSSCFAELIRDNNLPHIRFHDLRHYHASWLYARGVPDQYAAQRLGHDIQILKSIYQHLGLDKKTEMDNSIRQMFNPKKDKEKETSLTTD